MARWRLLAGVALALTLAACSRTAGCARTAVSGGDGAALEDPAMLQPGRASTSNRVTIVFLGDSLTAGLGLTSAQAYPSVIGEMFASEGYWEVEVVNGGLSGDTTAGARRRLGQLLAPDVRIVVVALGGNDALRGLTVAQTYDNLAAIIEEAFANSSEVLLAGMEGPTNLGEDYRAAFRNVYSRLAGEYGRRISYVPFLLEGVGGMPQLNQADGIHPTAEGARLVAEHLYPTLRAMVDLIAPAGGSQ